MTMLGLMMDYPLTLTAIMSRAAALSPDVEVVTRAVDRSIERHTYRAVLERVTRLAAALRGLGVGPGDRVATLTWNHHQHLEAYLAVPCLGAVLHTLNVRLPTDDLAYVLAHADDRILIVDAELFPLVEKCLPRTNLQVIVVIDAPDPEAVAFDYERMLAAADVSGFEWPQFDERTAASLCYTSGTTDRPKGVLYSHRSMVLQCLHWMAADTFALSRRDVVMAVVPMFHVNGWCVPFTSTLVGAKLVLPNRFLDPVSLLDLIEREKVTLSVGVPSVWQAVLRTLDAEPGAHDVRSLRTLVLGGSSVPESLIRGFQEGYGITVIQAWGMTETTSAATALPVTVECAALPTEAQYKWRARQGTPVPFVEIRARGEDGLVAWDGQTMGELEVRGPTVVSRYYKSTEPGASFTDDGWFRTGDIVSIDRHGCVSVRDRLKDLVRSGGEWISSIALENALMSHSSIAEAVVVAVPHPTWGERPLAVVLLKTGTVPNEQQLREFLVTRVPKWHVPDAFAFVDEIPKNGAGKALKGLLRDRYKAHFSEQSEGATVLPGGTAS